VSTTSYLCLLIPHSNGTGAHRRPAARGAHRFDIQIQLLKVASQGVAVHAELSSSSDLIPIHLSENCSKEGLLKFPHRFRVRSAAPVHVQNEFLQLFFHREPFQGGEKEKAVTLVTL
jgi:hypothetical protein